MTVLVAISDLMFLSKVDVTAAQLQSNVIKASKSKPLVDEVRASGATRVILDLAAAPFGGVAAVRAIRAAIDLRDVEIVGYCRHTEEALIHEAIEAGCTDVLTQGQLSSRLHQLLGP